MAVLLILFHPHSKRLSGLELHRHCFVQKSTQQQGVGEAGAADGAAVVGRERLADASVWAGWKQGQGAEVGGLALAPCCLKLPCLRQSEAGTRAM